MFRVSIKFLVLLIMSYLFAFIQGGGLPYRIFHGIIITFVTSLIFVLLKQKDLKVQVKFDKKIYSAGEEHEFITIIKNYGILPAPCVIVRNKTLQEINSKYNGDAVTLNFDDSKWIRNTVKFNHRGIYNFGLLEININDLFSIFQRKRNVDLNILVKVYPRIYELSKFTANGSDIFKNAISYKSNIEDLYSTREIRKYAIGDNLKRINWKVSAKHGELFVRNLDTVSGEESNIFLDMGKSNILSLEDENREEQLVDLCASLINFMQLKNIRTRLFINSSSQNCFDIESREDLNNLMEFFISLKNDGDNDFIRFINSYLNKVPKLSWIGIVTSNINKQLKDALIILRDKGYNITLFYSAGSLKDITYNEILKKSGIECYSLLELINKQGSRVRR